MRSDIRKALRARDEQVHGSVPSQSLHGILGKRIVGAQLLLRPADNDPMATRPTKDRELQTSLRDGEAVRAMDPRRDDCAATRVWRPARNLYGTWTSTRGRRPRPSRARRRRRSICEPAATCRTPFSEPPR